MLFLVKQALIGLPKGFCSKQDAPELVKLVYYTPV